MSTLIRSALLKHSVSFAPPLLFSYSSHTHTHVEAYNRIHTTAGVVQTLVQVVYQAFSEFKRSPCIFAGFH